jgi:hypothetical protein
MGSMIRTQSKSVRLGKDDRSAGRESKTSPTTDRAAQWWQAVEERMRLYDQAHGERTGDNLWIRDETLSQRFHMPLSGHQWSSADCCPFVEANFGCAPWENGAEHEAR